MSGLRLPSKAGHRSEQPRFSFTLSRIMRGISHEDGCPTISEGLIPSGCSSASQRSGIYARSRYQSAAMGDKCSRFAAAMAGYLRRTSSDSVERSLDNVAQRIAQIVNVSGHHQRTAEPRINFEDDNDSAIGNFIVDVARPAIR
jgi:hypothetical protein